MGWLKLKTDKKKRKLYKKIELREISFKYLLLNAYVLKSMRYLMHYLYLKNKNRYFFTNFINYCLKTSTPRWVFQKLRMGRMSVKESARSAMFTGIRKSNW